MGIGDYIEERLRFSTEVGLCMMATIQAHSQTTFWREGAKFFQGRKNFSGGQMCTNVLSQWQDSNFLQGEKIQETPPPRLWTCTK